MSYMKTSAITIRLDQGLAEMLDRACRGAGRSRGEVVREALRRQLTLGLFEEVRRERIPFAEPQGIFTDGERVQPGLVTRICLDSSVLVAAFIARGLCADLLRLVLAEHDPVNPEIVAEEVRCVLGTKLKTNPSALSTVDAVFERCSRVPDENASCPITLRDPDEQRVLAGALSAGVEILVTGNQDLLVAADESPSRILSPRAFLSLARGGTFKHAYATGGAFFEGICFRLSAPAADLLRSRNRSYAGRRAPKELG